MLKIRRPLGRLIFNMGIAIPGKTVFLIETALCLPHPVACWKCTTQTRPQIRTVTSQEGIDIDLAGTELTHVLTCTSSGCSNKPRSKALLASSCCLLEMHNTNSSTNQDSDVTRMVKSHWCFGTGSMSWHDENHFTPVITQIPTHSLWRHYNVLVEYKQKPLLDTNLIKFCDVIWRHATVI